MALSHLRVGVDSQAQQNNNTPVGEDTWVWQRNNDHSDKEEEGKDEGE